MSSNVMQAAYDKGGKSFWGGLEVSQKASIFIPYRDYQINIYESDSRDGDPIKYFASPIVLLNPKSAKYSFNRIKEKHEVTFKVDMWNQDVQDFVVNHLNQLPNRPKTDRKHVQGIPFEEVILCSDVISPMYELVSEWKPYQFNTVLNFTLNCRSEEKGRELEMLLKSDRDFQSHFAECFRIKLCVTPREFRQKNVKISIDNITSGRLCAKIDQRFPNNAEQVLLTAEDTKTFLSESVNNVLIESFTDMKEVADPAAKNRIYSILKIMLSMAQEKINSDSSKTWDSVFWNVENTRPDKVATTLNEFYNKSDKETKDKMKESFSKFTNASVDVDAQTRYLKMLNIKVEEGDSSSNSTSSSNSKDSEKYDKEMKEIAEKVEWNGEKFVPKPMYLTRLNLSTIRNRQTFVDKEISISYSTAFLDLKLNVPIEGGGISTGSNQHSTIDSFASIQKMKSEMDQLKRLVEGYHSTGTFLWRITNYSSKKADKDVTFIYSDPFYTSQNGYKLKVRFYPSGVGDGNGTHLSIYMEIQPGEYDALLPWPFSYKVTFVILDQSANTTERNNVEHLIPDSWYSQYPYCFQRPLDNKANLSIGIPKLAPHKLLDEGGKYVKDDTLYIKITITSETLTSEFNPNLDLAVTQVRQLGEQVKETSSELSKLKTQVSEFKPKLDMAEAQILQLDKKVKGYQSTSPFVWRITDYRSKKADTSVTYIYSDPFYTSQYGYKLKIQLNPNGDGDGKDTHLAIYFEIQPGEYDALLPWPFSHKLTFTLLDQFTNTTEKNNVEWSITDSSYSQFPDSFKRPLDNKANLGLGTSTFVSHELLDEGGKYVKDDTLFIKITTSH